jgi:hypothetical protein
VPLVAGHQAMGDLRLAVTQSQSPCQRRNIHGLSRSLGNHYGISDNGHTTPNAVRGPWDVSD